MNFYHTELVTNELSKDELLYAILGKNKKGHCEKILHNLPDTGLKELSCGKRKELVILTEKENKLTAIQYLDYRNPAVIKNTSYILDEANHTLVIDYSINNPSNSYITYDSSEKSFQPMKKALHHLCVKGYIAKDCILPLSDKPYFVNAKHCDLLWDKSKNSKMRLPLILVTQSFWGKYPVNIYKLSTLLFGLAHVLVIHDRKCFHHSNKYSKRQSLSHKGFVSIIYPGENIEHSKNSNLETDLNEVQIFQKIIFHMATQKYSGSYTFEHLRYKLLQREKENYRTAYENACLSKDSAENKYVHLKNHLDEEKKKIRDAALENALDEADQIVDSYEKEIHLLRDTIYEKNLYLQGLEVENNRLKKHLDCGKVPILFLGNEQEFYLGEIQDLLLSTLEDSLENITKGTRKYDVITDILRTNDYKHISKSLNEQARQLLKSYNGMSAKVRQGLEELGFSVDESGKHCKVCYHGDNRYLVVIASTPSDVRCGKNIASNITRMAY